MLNWYQNKLTKYPVLTPSITAAVLFALGDVIAQQFVEKKGFQNNEWGRTARMSIYGTVIWRPAVATWFKFLQNNISLRNKNAEILARVAIDQSLFAPTSLCVFLTSMSIMEGKRPLDKLEASYTTALLRNWMVWPFVQLINFRFVPLEKRVIFVNTILLGWNCYLSYINNLGGTSATIPVDVPEGTLPHRAYTTVRPSG
ncbi:protein sym-1 [Naviculisporaceae sp. PSN 640]